MANIVVELGPASGTPTQVDWPDRCACCGKLSPGAHGTLAHTILAPGTTASGSVMVEPVRVQWQVPTCPDCLNHQRTAAQPSPVSPPILAGILILLWLGIGWQLFTMGLGEDIVAITAFATITAATGAAVYALHIWLDKSGERRAREAMSPNCAAPDAAVHAFSPQRRMLLSFDSAAYGREFATLNALKIVESGVPGMG